MFDETTDDHFKSFEEFTRVYYDPIRQILEIKFGEHDADDLTAGFFSKLLSSKSVETRPVVAGKFRYWLIRSALNYAIDVYRKENRRAELLTSFEANLPAVSGPSEVDELEFESDELYSLCFLHIALNQIKKTLQQERKEHYWMIFDELVLVPLQARRIPKSRAELLAMFPGRPRNYLDNCVTTVKRLFKRILPAVIPDDLTDRLSPEERFEEWFEIMRTSKAGEKNRLWLAFLTDPTPGTDSRLDASANLAEHPFSNPGQETPFETYHDELRILLAFWLEKPCEDFIGPLKKLGIVPQSAPCKGLTNGRNSRADRPAPPLCLRALTEPGRNPFYSLSAHDREVILTRVKDYAKRIYNAVNPDQQHKNAEFAFRCDHSMPADVAHVLYNLAGALALTTADARIVGLDDAQFRKNISWILRQQWLDSSLRPIFSEAMAKLATP